MSQQEKLTPEQELDADSKADMWCSLAIVLLTWVAAMVWLNNSH